MNHSFSVEVAKEYGIHAAILLENLHFWCAKNRANGESMHEGLYWTYNSVSAFKELFPYMTSGQISRNLAKLEENGLIVTGNFNKSAYDRTKWYAVTDLGNSFFGNQNVHFAKMENGACKTNEPIPDINTDTKPNINEDKKRPSAEDVEAYCKEKGYRVDARRFIDYYMSNGWKVGKNPMKDWKAAVRTWHYRDNPKPVNESKKTACCPNCGTSGRNFWRQTQTGKYWCEICRETVSKTQVVWR